MVEGHVTVALSTCGAMRLECIADAEFFPTSGVSESETTMELPRNSIYA